MSESLLKDMSQERVAWSIEAERTRWDKQVSEALVFHKARVDQGLDPRCGLRLMVEGSATVVPDIPLGSACPWATFSSDSRDAKRYKVAQDAAAELVAYSKKVRS